MSSFRLSGATASGKRYYRSEFEFPRSGPRGPRAVLPLEVPLEVPQWGPNLTGSKAVPERYQSGTAVTSLRYLTGTMGGTTARKRYYRSRYYRGTATRILGQSQCRLRAVPWAVPIGVAVLPLQVPVVPAWLKLVFFPFSLQPCHLAIHTQNQKTYQLRFSLRSP